MRLSKMPCCDFIPPNSSAGLGLSRCREIVEAHRGTCGWRINQVVNCTCNAGFPIRGVNIFLMFSPTTFDSVVMQAESPSLAGLTMSRSSRWFLLFPTYACYWCDFCSAGFPSYKTSALSSPMRVLPADRQLGGKSLRFNGAARESSAIVACANGYCWIARRSRKNPLTIVPAVGI